MDDWTTIVEITLWVLAGALAVPAMVFALECMASLPWRPLRNRITEGKRPLVAVLIPAHNEETGIRATIESIAPQLGDNDRILVVADNCDDGTAEVARRAAADVVERTDTTTRGKSAAIAFGLRLFAVNPPDVVIFVDADCVVHPGSVEELARAAGVSERPAQALNLAEPAPGTRGVHLVSGLGFRFKNLVRTLGLARLGLPVHLTGTGMALPWVLVDLADWEGNELAEDMQLGATLAARGRSAIFCPAAKVTSELAGDRQSFLSQRTRWEQGHLATMFKYGPRLFLSGLKRLDPRCLALSFDLTVPPFSLFLILWGLLTSVAGAFAIAGVSAVPLWFLISMGGVIGVSIALGWFFHCRKAVPLSALFCVPGYILSKVGIYLRFPFRREKEWVRTARQ